MRQECGAIYLDVGRADGVLRLSNGYMGGLLYPENPSMVDAAAFVADSISGHKIHGKIYCLPLCGPDSANVSRLQAHF